jgi:hypothetical protein
VEFADDGLIPSRDCLVSVMPSILAGEPGLRGLIPGRCRDFSLAWSV